MTTYLTVQELQALPRNERIAYTQSLHENTMNNLRKINATADAEIALINEIIARG